MIIGTFSLSGATLKCLRNAIANTTAGPALLMDRKQTIAEIRARGK